MVYMRNRCEDTSNYYSLPIDQPAVHVGNDVYEYGDAAERTPRFLEAPLTPFTYELPTRP